MKIVEEKSFPRGGKKPIIGNLFNGEKPFPRGVQLDLKRKKKSAVPKVKRKDKPKKQKPVEELDESDVDYEKLLEEEEEEEELEEELGLKKEKPSKTKTFIKTITNKTISEGLVVLGCVGEVNEFELKVNLPGRIIAYVPISNISDPYNAVIQEVLKGEKEEPGQLSEMFKVGQFVIVRIEKIERFEDSRNKLTLTLNPSSIYSDWTFRVMQKGLVLSSAVRSIEDHGYVMDFGIPNIRAFLKKQNAVEYEKMCNDGRQLVVGQVLHCLVNKTDVCEDYCTVEVTVAPTKVTRAKLDTVALSSIVPGMLFNVQVKEVTDYGLVVNFAEDMTGYVHEDHLKNTYTILSSMQVGHELPARVLYIEPYTKHVYFTLRKSVCDFKTSTISSLQRGCIVNSAKVVAVKNGTLYLKLNEKEHLYGIVTLRHLDKTVEADSEASMDRELRKTYLLGSHVRCRVLGYDYMLQVFTCTLEKALLKQPYISPEDSKPGDVVDCVIQKAAPRGIQVAIGTVKGFVDPLHFADIPVAHPEKMFPAQKKVKARVLKALKSAVEVTLRPSLVNSSNPILHNYEDAEEDKEYDGMVVEVKPKGCLVKFYGNVMGWLQKADYFKGEPPEVGQVVKCKVYYSDPDEQRILLRLSQNVLKPIKKECNLKVGHFYEVSVTDVMVDGLVVSVEEDPIKGIIPAQQLSDTKKLGFLLCQTYKRGDKLKACCLSIQDNAIFSTSPTFLDFFQSRAGKDLSSLGAKAVTQSMTVPTLIMQITREMVIVDVPVPGMLPAFLLKRNVCDGHVDDFASLGLEIYQTLVIKFLQIKPDSNPFASSKLSAVWNGYAENGVKLLQGYIDDVEKVIQHLEASEDPLADLFPGCEVEGVVMSCLDSGVIMRLTNGADAVVPPEHFEEGEVYEGMSVSGIVMFIDVLNNCAEVTLKEDAKDSIREAATNFLTDSDVGREMNGHVLLRKPNLVLVCLRDKEKSFLAFAPSQRHVNDLNPNSPVKLHGRYVIKLVKGATAVCVPKKMDITKERIMEKAKEKKMEEKKAQTRKSFSSQKSSEEDKRGLKLNNEDRVRLTNGVPNKPNEVKKRKLSVSETGTAESGNNVLASEVVAVSSGKKSKTNKTKNERRSLSVLAVSPEEAVTPKKKKKKKLTASKTEESAVNNDGILEQGGTKIAKKKRKNSFNDLENETGVETDTPKRKKKTLTATENKKNLKLKKKKLKQSNMDPPAEKEKKKKSSASCEVPNESSSLVVKTEGNPVPQKSCLDVDAGFVWDAKPEHLQALSKDGESDESSSEDEKEEESLNKKKKKKRLSAAEKKAQMREEEERLRQVEMRLMDAEKNPQSADDFERLVLSTPNNSKNWIKYMAFHLQATEIEKARAVGQRALETIVFREEQEKLNVWMALLNLENLYGSKESFDQTLQKAVQCNDDYKVYMQVIQMYADSGKVEELDSLVRMVSKKYKSKKDMWLRVGAVYMKLGQFDKARQVMQRAILALEKQVHVELISRFALLENDNGQSERAETLMENILTSYPKRVDVWNLYVDMLVKSKKIALARGVLERSVVQKLPVNKLRSLYKKFLKFEQDHGTPEGEEKVRAMAKEYIEKTMRTLE